MKKLIIAVLILTFYSCGVCTKDSCSTTTKTMKKFTTSYTNSDYYKDGVFQPKVAEKAFREMFAHYDYPITPELEANWWFVDFGIGDFANCGMGGVFFINDADNGYAAHEIYLLPGQMIPEHAHKKTDHPAKAESWLVREGWAYNFSEVGELTEDAEQIIPASQLSSVKSRNYAKQLRGDFKTLKKLETFHFLCAGDEGAIISEYSNYHDGNGLCFSNITAKM